MRRIGLAAAIAVSLVLVLNATQFSGGCLAEQWVQMGLSPRRTVLPERLLAPPVTVRGRDAD